MTGGMDGGMEPEWSERTTLETLADHVRWSEERFYMAVLMGAAMALVMLAFMRSMMYKDRRLNVVIVAVAVLLGAGALYLSRSQALVDDLPLVTSDRDLARYPIRTVV